MASLLRRRLECFYCGHKSALKKEDSLRKWNCTNCGADNHLDENGQITDPPPAPDTPRGSPSFVSQLGSFGSPDLVQASDIFCSTCINNQNIFVQALANYFPDDVDDPKYAEYEVQFPIWKAEMEKRYPQVCATCAPQANNRIQSMTYLAQAENLKLKLETTRRFGSRRESHTIRNQVIRLAGLTWFTSILLQTVWHGLGILHQDPTEGIVPYPQCIYRSFGTKVTNLYCLDRTASWVPIALVIGVLSSWWNPKLLNASRTAGKLLNQRDYYVIQIVLLTTRIGGYFILTKRITRDHPEQHRRVHGFLLIFLVLCTVISFLVVEFRKRPIITDFRSRPVEAPPVRTPVPTITPSTLQNSSASKASFPVSALAPPDFLRPSRFPDPPSSTTTRRTSISTTTTTALSLCDVNLDDDYSEMDWIPTGPSAGFNPRMHINSLAAATSVTPQGSPFRGKLPPAPIHPYHQAAKPPPQPTFFKAPEEKRVQFQATMMGQKGNSFNPEGGATPRAEMDMRPATLAMVQEDTGLESLFGTVFNLTDEPKGVQDLWASQQIPRRTGWLGAVFWTVLIAGVCSVAINKWLMLKLEQPVMVDT